jgi:hypothetical protein
VLLPLTISYGLTRLRVDSRSAHAAAGCWLSYLVRPRRLVAFQRARSEEAMRFADLPMAPDASGRWCRGVVRGPAEVVVSVAARHRRRLGRTELRRGGGAPATGDRLILRPGERLVLR